MAKEPKMPAARTVPADDVQGDPDWDDNGGSVDIQKGMPARNIKSAFIVIMLVAVLIFLFWPRGPRTNKNVQAVEATKLNIVDDLVRGAPKAIKEAAIEPPVPPAAAKDEKKEVDERIMAALLAPMSATEVSLVNQAKKNSPANQAAGDLKTFLTEQQARADEVKRNAERQAAEYSGGGQRSAPGAAGQGEGDSRENFLLAQKSGLDKSIRMDAARRPSSLYEGTIIRGVLTRALKTDLPGTLTAKVSADLYDTVTQTTLLVPRGSEINCAYQSDLRVGQELVLVACKRLRMPNGKSFSLDAAVASNMQGASGLDADINNHFLKMFGNALIVGAASRLLPKSEQQISVTQGDSGTAVGGAILGAALSKIIDATISRNVIIPPTGTVDIGTPFTLTLSRDVELEPYSFQ